MVRRRARCIQVDGVNKGSWTEEEDAKLAAYVKKHGHDNWRTLPKLAGLKRCGKSCRLRWINYLSPNVKRGNFTKEEEEIIIRLHAFLGNKWSKIASCLPGRTDNEVKNVWHTYLKKRLAQVGEESSAHQLPSRKKAAGRRLSQDACSAAGANGPVNGDRAAGLNVEEAVTVLQPGSCHEYTLSSDHELNCSSMEYSCVTSFELFQEYQSWPLLQQQSTGDAVDQDDQHGHLLELSTVDPEEVWRFMDQDVDVDCFLQFARSPDQAMVDDHDPLAPPGAVDNCNINIINAPAAGWRDDQEQRSSSCSSTWDIEKESWLEYLEKELEL